MKKYTYLIKITCAVKIQSYVMSPIMLTGIWISWRFKYCRFEILPI